MLVCAVNAKPALRAEHEAEKPFDRSGSRPRRATLDVTLTLFHQEGKRHSGVVGRRGVVTSAADKGKSGGYILLSTRLPVCNVGLLYLRCFYSVGHRPPAKYSQSNFL